VDASSTTNKNVIRFMGGLLFFRITVNPTLYKGNLEALAATVLPCDFCLNV
jgi:hypothetical protein